jgi:hypothetical protein
MLVGELGDTHCALVPPHDAAVVLKCFYKCGGGGGHHLKTFILGEFLAISLFVDALIQLALVVNQTHQVGSGRRKRECGGVSHAWKRGPCDTRSCTGFAYRLRQSILEGIELIIEVLVCLLKSCELVLERGHLVENVLKGWWLLGHGFSLVGTISSALAACAVGPSSQARDAAQQEEEEEHADLNLRKVTIKRRKKGLHSSTQNGFYET